jgi:hypothetical protein
MEYENRLVAFIDILGFKEMVRESENNPSKIELLNFVLNYLKDLEVPEKWDLKLVEIEEDAQKRGIDKFDIREKTNCTSFSDSIVVSVKVDSNINEMASTLIVNLAKMGAILFERGVLFRGGLTLGNIIHNQNGTVFGQGLIDAYILESKYAKYPRIIISDKLLKKLNYPVLEERERSVYHQYIERFEDGCVGFHQMIFFEVIQSWSNMIKGRLVSSLDTIRKVIIDGLDTSFERPKVYEKYKWLQEQYNKLIIFDDFDFEKQSEGNMKLKIRELNEGIAGRNIHYSYTDDFYVRKIDK